MYSAYAPAYADMSLCRAGTLWRLSFILLIACINVANLALVHTAERQKELAAPLALGARRGRIIRQLLSGSLLIAALGGACGLLMGIMPFITISAQRPGHAPLTS